MIGEIISLLEAMIQALRRANSINVNDSPTKSQAISISQRYFSTERPLLLQIWGETPEILDHDAKWQQLVRLAHGNNARKSYMKVVKSIKKELSEFNIYLLTTGLSAIRSPPPESRNSSEEARILETLERLIQSAGASYRQGLDDLKNPDRLSYRGTAAEFREVLRETLDHLAPDEQVILQEGFKLEVNLTKPTTKQKVRYILASRGKNKTQRTTAEKAVELVEELTGEVTRAIYNHASLATHIQQSREEVARIKRYVDTVLFDILEISR